MILCLGTTPTVQRTMTFARLTLDAVNRAKHVHEFASGKSINVARVLKTIGADPLATGFVGGDTGRRARADLDVAGIAHDFLDVAPPTRMCVTIVDESTRTATELIEESKPVERDDYARLTEKLAALIGRGPSALVLSGTLPPDAPERFYANCVSLAGPSVPVILDAKGASLDGALEERPMVVKVNRAELAQTLEADVDDDDALRGAMRQMIVRGARWLIVTAGAAPTYLTDGRRFWRIDTPTVESVNPIGSGDAFAAGLAAGMTRGQDVPGACALATACAAANAMTPHAGHVNLTDVEQLLPRVQVQAM